MICERSVLILNSESRDNLGTTLVVLAYKQCISLLRRARTAGQPTQEKRLLCYSFMVRSVRLFVLAVGVHHAGDVAIHKFHDILLELLGVIYLELAPRHLTLLA